MQRGAMWMTYSFVVGFGFQGIYFLLNARQLGPEEFGIFSGALALATILSTVAGLGAGNNMVIFVSRQRGQFNAHYGTALVYVILTWVPLALIGTTFASLVGNEFLMVFLVLTVSELAFMRLVDVSYQAFQAVDRLAVTANLNVAIAASRLIAVLAFGEFARPTALMWSLVYASITVSLGIVYSLLVVLLLGRPTWDTAVLRNSWRVGIFFSLGMSSRVVYTDGDKYVLNAYGLPQVAGEYGAASRLVAFAYAPMQAILYSANTSMYRAGSEGYVAVWKFCLSMAPRLVGLGLAAGVVLTVISPIIPLALGDDYSSADVMVRSLAGVPLLMVLHTTIGDALMGLGQQHLRAAGQALMAGIAITINLLLVPHASWEASVLAQYTAHVGILIVNVSILALGIRRELPRKGEN